MMKGLYIILPLIMMLSGVKAGSEDDSEQIRNERSQRVNGPYTKKFNDLLGSRSFLASEIGGKIFRKVWKAGVDGTASIVDYEQCPQRLLHIIEDKLND